MLGVCMAGGMCVVGGMHDRGQVWQGVCMAGGMGGMHGTPTHPHQILQDMGVCMGGGMCGRGCASHAHPLPDTKRYSQ